MKYCERKLPGQAALFQKEQENNSSFGGFGSEPVNQKPQYPDSFASFSPLEQDRNLQLPPFPVECLPDEIRHYAEALAESLQVPVDMPAISILGKIALCIQGKVEIEPKPGWRDPLNLYLVIVSRPSERKSSVEKATSKPIFEYAARVNEERREAIEEFEDWAGKLHGNIMRIAGLMHVVKHTFNPGGVLLEKDTMEKAITIRDYFLKHSKAAFDIMSLSDPPEVRDAKYIISKIDAITKTTKTTENPTALSKIDVWKACYKCFKKVDEMESGLEAFYCSE